MREINGQKVTYSKWDMPVGLWPHNIGITPNGRIGISADNGNGSLAVLKIDGKKVTRVGEVEVGALPEGAVFSPDGKYLYVGNYIDRDVSILKVDGTTITNTGKKLTLPGQPASMRGPHP
jgi:DNA-binding beta-propeller fold protein YncE